jgi:hypothetical protein
MGNKKNGKNVKRTKEYVDIHDFWVTQEPECFICLQYDCGSVPRLNEQQIYVKVCKCDGWVHNRCLKTWVNINNKCPICCILVEKKPLFPKSCCFITIIFVGCGLIISGLYVYITNI